MKLAHLDFETYSEVGHVWDERAGVWRPPPGANKKGIFVVGTAAYAEHPSTEILSAAYDLNDGRGVQLWTPDMPPPVELLNHVFSGRIVAAWHSAFEFEIWRNVGIRRHDWPPLELDQMFDTMALALSHSWPGKLDKAAERAQVPQQKIADGKRLIRKFSVPRKPTKGNPNKRLMPADDPVDWQKFNEYNIADVAAERDTGRACPPLTDYELKLWRLDQVINERGIAIDRDALRNCIGVVDRVLATNNAEMREITGGVVQSTDELAKLQTWLQARGYYMHDMTKGSISHALDHDRPLDPAVCRTLELRQLSGLASIKKLYAINNRLSWDGRLRWLVQFYGAHTGRWAGRGPQPHNLPKQGPDVVRCAHCDSFSDARAVRCAWCEYLLADVTPQEWSPACVDDALAAFSGHPDQWGAAWPNALHAVSGCLRGLFVAADGKELIGSDYTSIEALLMAVLSGEQWRIDLFVDFEKPPLYAASAERITGVPMGDEGTHPQRQLGKLAELAGAYGGWIGAYKAFGADKYFPDDDAIKAAILDWRRASPMIVEFWGGQVRKHPDVWEWTPDLHGLEGAAVRALQTPGQTYMYRDIAYLVQAGNLYCRLPSGRWLTYHNARLVPTVCRRSGLDVFSIQFEGWNSDRNKGPIGWIVFETYGGKLAENVIQAVARDIMADGLIRLEEMRYWTVLHVHDEGVSEVPRGFGSIAEYETILGHRERWYADYPIRVSGGWRGHRFGKY